MKSILISLSVGFLSVLLFTSGTNSHSKNCQSSQAIDSSKVATLSYPGSKSTIKISLFKINGKPRSEYIEKSLPWSYNKIWSLGFDVEVPAGENTFELLNNVKKEIVKITLNLENKTYECDFKEDYKVYEVDAANNKKEIPVKVEKVAIYDEKAYAETATLHIDKQDNMPLIFRINSMAATADNQGTLGINGLYIINKKFSISDIQIPVGQNIIEIGISGTSSGLSGQKYFAVQTLEFNAIKGKTYTIKVDKKELEKKVFALSAHIEEK